MVIHQTECVAQPIISFNGVEQYFQKSFSVFIFQEDNISRVTTRCDVINSSWIFLKGVPCIDITEKLIFQDLTPIPTPIPAKIMKR